MLEIKENMHKYILTKKQEVKSEERRSFFTNKYTNVAKGIAILFMLFHHLGLNPELNLFESTSIFFKVASQCKICVAIFVILSGYGLNASFNKKYKGKTLDLINFTLKHLLKLMISFWVIFIIFVSFGCLSGLRTLDVYGSNISKNLIIDFLGMANLLKTNTYNATWWFMSLIIILYAIFPVLKLILKKSPLMLGCLAVFVSEIISFKYATELKVYLLAFCLGMIFSELCLFDKIRKTNKTRTVEIISTLIFLLVALYLRYKIGGTCYDTIAAFACIFLCNNILIDIPGMNNILELLGKHSANIFMFHTFIYKYFFNSWFAKMNHWILMYIALVVSTLLISIVIEKAKEIVKKTYSRLKEETGLHIKSSK